MPQYQRNGNDRSVPKLSSFGQIREFPIVGIYILKLIVIKIFTFYIILGKY